MGKRPERRSLLVALLAAVLIGIGLGPVGQGSAEPISGCAGKPLCASVADLEWASRSPSVDDRRYMTDSIVVENSGSTSNLVNISVTITWKDEPNPDTTVPTTSTFLPLNSFSDEGSGSCLLTAPRTLTCSTPKSLRPGEKLMYSPLVFGTATDTNSAGTTVIVTAAAKEQDRPSKGGTPPNDAVVSVSNTTPYEPRDDEDLSIAGDGLSATLATASVGSQYSRLPVPASADRELYGLFEAACETGFTCLPGSQLVTTTAPGLAPVNLWITYTGSTPGGTTEKSIVVLHDRSSTPEVDPVTISADCGTELFSGVEPATIPCRTVEITHLPGGIARIHVDVWDTENGKWGFG